MNTVLGILAHVDAGKTTLAEAMLYRSGVIRTLGRVDTENTLMDAHKLERQRGITIFSSEAAFCVNGVSFSLIDTPGHVDFSAETERALSVLDYAILVISGTDGVQAHTRTLWRLLMLYNIPVIIFVTKMDFARRDKAELMRELKKELSDNCVDFQSDAFFEAVSLTRDDLLDKFLESGSLDMKYAADAVKAGLVFPCFFGSGLKLDGVDAFLNALPQITAPNIYPKSFGARVYKISRDKKGERLTHMKITGGVLNVRDKIGENKINSIRIYSGDKFETADFAQAGQICTVTGLNDTYGGQRLGTDADRSALFLEPVMNYKLTLPSGCDPQTLLPKLRLLQEEDPQLKFTWNEYLGEIYVSLMGEVQTEILKSIVADRFDVDIGIGAGRVMYKETITDTVEGVGHYEPLRHYAEVHLILSPAQRGQGIVIESNVSEDILDRNWQRLIMMHLSEKEHIGVLTGSPVTDIKITLAAGRAHLKHTEGGDFRQATYRAVRQGLMQAHSQLLEPYYSFRLEVPPEQIGRAINDMRMRSGTFDPPEDIGGMYLLCGRVPVTEMDNYSAELASYTAGRGRIFLEVEGYDICHNADKVTQQLAYRPESDIDNTPDSVFCAHGAGFNVKWDKVPEYMHIESCLKKQTVESKPKINKFNINIDEKELEQIMLREFGPIRRREYGIAKVQTKTHEEVKAQSQKKRVLIIDGYNVIFAWEDLKKTAESELAHAREKLVDIMVNYCAFTKTETVIVFDAYRVENGVGERFDKNGVHVVFTKENQTGDAYIEKLVSDIGKNHSVSVVTSDGLIQLSAVRAGVLRISAREFEQEVDRVYSLICDSIKNINKD